MCEQAPYRRPSTRYCVCTQSGPRVLEAPHGDLSADRETRQLAARDHIGETGADPLTRLRGVFDLDQPGIVDQRAHIRLVRRRRRKTSIPVEEPAHWRGVPTVPHRKRRGMEGLHHRRNGLSGEPGQRIMGRPAPANDHDVREEEDQESTDASADDEPRPPGQVLRIGATRPSCRLHRTSSTVSWRNIASSRCGVQLRAAASPPLWEVEPSVMTPLSSLIMLSARHSRSQMPGAVGRHTRTVHRSSTTTDEPNDTASTSRSPCRRWVIERTMSWLTGYRRLNHRYERHPRNYPAFLGLAATLCCYKRLLRLTTQDTV
ncbi:MULTISPECIES: transposase [Streptomyces]|uniref:transposase n=1 Tax=Streptomyces TaxID=1883 RepID=UPI0035A0B272